MNTQHKMWSAVGGLMAILAVGCGEGDGLERIVVSGHVSFDGQTVQIGQIRFIPQGTQGPVTIEMIRNGSYDTSSTGGVPVGTHRVEILAYNSIEYAEAPTGPGSPPVKQLLPPKYNRKSELALTVDLGGGALTKDFELTRQ